MVLSIKSGKLSECSAALLKLIKLADEPTNNISFKISYWAIRTNKKVEPEELVYREQKDKIIIKYGTPIKGTEKFGFETAEAAEKYAKALEVLNNTDIEISDVHTINLSAFNECLGVSSAINTLIDILIVDDTAEPESKPELVRKVKKN